MTTRLDLPVAHAVHYRPDIDGLRAIAVLSVIVFHLGIGTISGGYVGVDVFFVISGYLISKIILSEIADRSFSLAKFYVRRARRILPALFAVMAISGLFASKYLYPAELVAFANSATAAALFSANVHFYSTLDYFAPAANETPLLHLWSLGVEEQFYFVFPLLALCLTKWKPRLLPPVVISVLIASLAASVACLKADPTAAFYLLPFRAFELLLGTLIALPGMPALRTAKTANALSIIGLAGIAVSLVLFTGNTPFPGVAALLPCISAALIIHSGKEFTTPVRWLLATRLLSGVGKISYSLYLIHWPVIVFGSRIFPGTERVPFAIAVVAITFVLAALNYHFVEQYFRRPRAWMSQTRVLGMSATAMLVVVGMSGFVTMHAGFPGDVSTRTSKVLSYLQYDPKPAFRSRTCFLDPDQDPAAVDFSQCMPRGAGTKAVLWGDSHAAHFFVGFDETLRTHGYSLGAVSASACPPILEYDAATRPHCRAFNDRVFPLILAQRPELVILSAYWPQDQAAFDSLERTVDKLSKAHIRVVILGESPLYKHSVPTLAADRIAAGSNDMYAPDELQKGFLASSDALFRKRFSNRENVTYIPVFKVVCPQDKCPLLAPDEVPVHFDTAHLTTSGSRLFARMLTPMLLADTPSAQGRGSD